MVKLNYARTLALVSMCIHTCLGEAPVPAPLPELAVDVSVSATNDADTSQSRPIGRPRTTVDSPSQSHRWDGMQSRDGNHINKMTCNYTVPALSQYPTQNGGTIYVYCDMHRWWPDGTTDQFVPQLMRGNVWTNCNPTTYQCGGLWANRWYIQAQYFFETNGGFYGINGTLIPVNVGDVISTRIYYGKNSAGEYSYTAQISADGFRTSSHVVVNRPFLGLNRNYQDKFGTSNPLYYKFTLGDLWEGYAQDYSAQYPSTFQWHVNWVGDADVGMQTKNPDYNIVTAKVTSKGNNFAVGEMHKR